MELPNEYYLRKYCGLIEPRSVGKQNTDIAKFEGFTRLKQCLSDATCTRGEASYISLTHKVFCDTELTGVAMTVRLNNTRVNTKFFYNSIDSNAVCDGLEIGSKCQTEGSVCVLAQTTQILSSDVSKHYPTQRGTLTINCVNKARADDKSYVVTYQTKPDQKTKVRWCDTDPAKDTNKTCPNKDIEYVQYLISNKAKAAKILSDVESYYKIEFITQKLHFI